MLNHRQGVSAAERAFFHRNRLADVGALTLNSGQGLRLNAGSAFTLANKVNPQLAQQIAAAVATPPVKVTPGITLLPTQVSVQPTTRLWFTFQTASVKSIGRAYIFIPNAPIDAVYSGATQLHVVESFGEKGAIWGPFPFPSNREWTEQNVIVDVGEKVTGLSSNPVLIPAGSTFMGVYLP